MRTTENINLIVLLCTPGDRTNTEAVCLHEPAKCERVNVDVCGARTWDCGNNADDSSGIHLGGSSTIAEAGCLNYGLTIEFLFRPINESSTSVSIISLALNSLPFLFEMSFGEENPALHKIPCRLQ